MRLSTDKSTYLLSTFLPTYLSILSPKTCFHATPSLTIWGQQDVPLDKQGLETRYPLHAAAVDGNVAKVKSLLGLGPETKGVRLFAGQLIVRESD